eukprot:c30502_g1_i1.p1 GENE.c30502_g1_i1~~c30502_g1_i1.p1  ORF type:complete len:145 (-),score=38.40 c30502_g1_i1:66-461(-)
MFKRFIDKITSSHEALVVTCFAAYLSPVVISKIPTPTEVVEGFNNRIEYRWEYESARGQYRHDYQLQGRNAERPAILNHLAYYVPPKPKQVEKKVEQVKQTSSDTSDFSTVSEEEFYNDGAKIEKFLSSFQ